jgi:hypothetical protein
MYSFDFSWYSLVIVLGAPLPMLRIPMKRARETPTAPMV